MFFDWRSCPRILINDHRIKILDPVNYWHQVPWLIESRLCVDLPVDPSNWWWDRSPSSVDHLLVRVAPACFFVHWGLSDPIAGCCRFDLEQARLNFARFEYFVELHCDFIEAAEAGYQARGLLSCVLPLLIIRSFCVARSSPNSFWKTPLIWSPGESL